MLTQVAAGPRIQAFKASEMVAANASPGIVVDGSNRVDELYAQWMMAIVTRLKFWTARTGQNSSKLIFIRAGIHLQRARL